ncbi:MAG: AbrB/MazE/SpoVT family DNA-binding domain-containing protein [bacterium]
MYTSRVSAKGAIVIPAKIRKKFGIEAGSQVTVIDSNGTIRIIPVPKDPIKALRGSLKFEETALQMKREMREDELRVEEKKWKPGR